MQLCKCSAKVQYIQTLQVGWAKFEAIFNSFKGSSFRKVACHCTNTVFLYSWFSSTEVQSWIINVVATHWRKGDNIFKIKSSPWHRKKTERLSRQVPRAAASWYLRGGNDGKQL